MRVAVVQLLLMFVCLAASAWAGDLPDFDSDYAADQWLREHSAYYQKMVAEIEKRTGYTFRRSGEIPAGLLVWESGRMVVEMSNKLSGAKRVSILIFEITNGYQSAKHQEVDAGANSGRITSPREFGILHELVELDGLRHHRAVLEDLDQTIHGIPAAMLEWIVPDLKTLHDYQVPYAYDFLKAQEASGHTGHYHEWFYKQAPAGSRPARP